MNKSAKESQSCTNDIILLIKQNVSSVVSAGFFSILLVMQYNCNTSVVIVFSFHTLMQISYKKTNCNLKM